MSIQAAVPTPRYACGTCGGKFKASEGYDDAGAFVCARCHQERQTLAEAETQAAQASAAQAAQESAARSLAQRTPEYPGIIKGAAIVQGYAQFLMLISIICFVAAVVLPLLMIVSTSPQFINGFTLAATFGMFLAIASMGLFYLIVSRLVMMLAELAIAHRDMARNSFR